MTISKLRHWVYRVNRALGDIQAVKRGRVRQRAENRMIGRLAARVMRRLWR